MYRDRGECPVLVIVSVPLVFVDRERSIGAGVDSQFDRVRGLLRRVLQIGPERQNRASANEQRFTIERSIYVKRFAATHRYASPEISPSRIRQIDAAPRRAGLRDRIHQNRRAK